MNKIANTIVNRDRKTKGGFTIVESLVSITILIVAVLGPMVIISQALKISYFARDQMTSFYLSQEAIEYVRNIRDKTALTQSDPNRWLENMVYGVDLVEPNTANNYFPTKYYLVRDSSGYKLLPCPGNVCPKLNYNPETGVYGEESDLAPNRDSIYTREVTFHKTPGALDDLVGNQEVLVNVKMTWTQIGGTYDFQLHEFLTNWKIQNYEVN